VKMLLWTAPGAIAVVENLGSGMRLHNRFTTAVRCRLADLCVRRNLAEPGHEAGGKELMWPFADVGSLANEIIQRLEALAVHSERERLSRAEQLVEASTRCSYSAVRQNK
jgi:hypothetical protein